ncbi:MAG TPA: GxxExxY protein [Caulobacteraceae bacterium]|nr:GxxExxY protein [Caulobacteraceae bacterium]
MVHEPHEPHEQLLFKGEVFRIQGAIFEVNRVLGAGFLEAVYQECLALEFEARDIPFAQMMALRLSYKGRLLQSKYVPDFVCFGSIIVELKALRELTSDHRAQVLNYLKASDLRLGLLVNFGAPDQARIERIIR